MRYVLLLSCVLICAACLPQAGFQVVPWAGSDTTEILSDPPGARIEINGDYVGDTPLFVRFKTGTAHGRFIDAMVVRALPRGAGQYTQTTDLHGVKIPRRMFFDMNLGPIENKVNVNVR